MANVGQFRNQPEDLREVTADLGPASINLVVNARQVTRSWVAELGRSERKGNALAVYSSLVEVVREWDLVNEDGSPFPLTVESLESLNLTLEQDELLIDAVTGTARPSEAEKKGSSEPSSTPPTVSEEPQPVSPNGSETSGSPAPSASPSPT